MFKFRSITINRKNRLLKLKLFKKLYCYKEFPNFKDKKFWNFNKKIFNKKNNILFISGGSRNGNHLVTSLLDSINEIPYYPGEDKFLHKIFTLSKNDHPKLLKKINKIKKKKNIFGKNKLYKKYWAGKHPERIVALYEHYNHLHNVDYDSFESHLKKSCKKKSNLANIFSIFKTYLDSYEKLCEIKSKTKFKYTYACSGMRSEMATFAKSKNNFKCIVPIRDFRSFYFSKIKGRFNTMKINNYYLNEAWEHWKHKTIDYLILKKKYPKKFILLRYEDLIAKKSTYYKLLNNLGIKKKYPKKSTIHNVPVVGNSSFVNVKRKPGEIRDLSKKRLLPKKFLPNEYYQISKLIKKYSL